VAATPGGRLLGIYLRGSVARGLFIEGVSDVDLVVLVAAAKHDPRAIERAAAAALAESTRAGSGGGGGGGDGNARAAVAAGLALASKVELRVNVVSPRDARLLEDACSEASAAAARSGGALPPSLVRRVLPRALAFELATGAVALLPSGDGAPPALDLPVLLPDVARLPPAPLLLATVAADVRRAVAAARGAAAAKDDDGAASAAASAAPVFAGGPSPRAAARWALKRCVRAALELQFCSARPAAPGRRWTRDLYHCAALTRAAAESGACPLSARVADAVDEALRLYVALLAPGGGGDALGADALAEASCAHAERLAGALDAAFLAAMLSEAPGWLTRHEPARCQGAGPRLQPRGKRRAKEGWWPWSFEKAADDDDAAAADVDADDARSPDNIAPLGERSLLMVGCDPPPVYVRISGPPRLHFDWGAAAGGEGLPAALAAALMLPASSSGAALPPQPVLLRGLAKDWPATRRWSFWSLLREGGGGGGLRGKARAAPSLAFPFCEPALRDLLVAARGPAAAPSLEVDDLSASEFVRAMLLRQAPTTTGTSAGAPAAAALARLPPSWGRPYLYLQAELPEAHPMRADVQQGLQELLTLLSSSSAASGDGAAAIRVAQAPRLWASARGSVSPTHFDRDASLLVQAVGRKRMLLFDPDTLECLHPYPEQHLLRRRARVNLAAAEEERAAGAGGGGGGARDSLRSLRSRLSAVEVVLEPGDAVFFPPEWAHYTESLSPSMSVTARFVAVAVGAESQM